MSIISVKNLNVYHAKNLVLKDVNIEINEGEFVYLIGRTGSGKSSLMSVLYADLPIRADEGEVEVAGYKLEKIPTKHIPMLRRKIGIVFQDYQLLTDRNIEKNLEYVLKATSWDDKKAIENRIEEVLTIVGLESKTYKMPHQLSGGEQQRVAIARALLNEPKIIFADEPTGDLDPATSEEIIQLLINISQKNCAVFIATHDWIMIDKFPARILVCEDGQVKAVKN
jgi:cell division transport system ATP-binding protein